MEACERTEIFDGSPDDQDFSHTHIVLRAGKENDYQYYYAITDRRYSSNAEINPLELDVSPTPPEAIWPPFPADFKKAPDPLPENCHVKRESPLPENFHVKREDLESHGEKTVFDGGTNLLWKEAQICEVLHKSPHPNIAQYYGCLVENGRIKGLCFGKYDMTLLEKTEHDSRPFDWDLCLRDIQKGIEHLHRLGLVHCDINPRNVMMNENMAVIIDFDSCHREGERLGAKAGAGGWTRDEFTHAERENDFYGLSKIRDFLFERKLLNDCPEIPYQLD